MPAPAPVRSWLGRLQLAYGQRRECSVLVRSQHLGPLRVQRPFYPEANGCCHTYILHPPGGMAVGDRIDICAELEPDTSVLFTTPSAGKMYGTLKVDRDQQMPQCQQVKIHVADGASAEWLPQETIIFDGAQARLESEFYLHANAKLIAWDIVRLGRVASGEQFNSGSCYQKLRLFVDRRLHYHELNPMLAGSAKMSAQWGLQNKNTFATMIATVTLDRDQQDELVNKLEAFTNSDAENSCLWGVTQKDDLLIVRYMGNKILNCRAGLAMLWSAIRPVVLNKAAVMPRIWNT